MAIGTRTIASQCRDFGKPSTEAALYTVLADRGAFVSSGNNDGENCDRCAQEAIVCAVSIVRLVRVTKAIKQIRIEQRQDL
jgi:hypothetical protein